MRIRAASWIAALSIAASAFAAPVSAQSPGRDPATGAKDSTSQAGKDIKKGAKEAGRALSQAFRDARDKLRQTRDERRRDERKDVRDKWGPLLTRQDVRDELRLHAQRMARLDYIEKV